MRHVRADGMFSWLEVECLGACCNAPMVQINDDYYEDLTPRTSSKLLGRPRGRAPVTIGSQIGRSTSEPAGGLTSLLSLYGVEGVSGPGAGKTIPTGAISRESDAAVGRDAGRRDPASSPRAPEPAMERRAQEDDHSIAKPRKPEDTGTRHTDGTLGQAQARQLETQQAVGGRGDGPSQTPGRRAAPDAPDKPPSGSQTEELSHA